MKLVLAELPIQLKDVSDDYKYAVTMEPAEGAILVTDSTITVKVSMTSPLLREQQGIVVFFKLSFVSNKKKTRFRVTSFNLNLLLHIINFFVVSFDLEGELSFY